MKKYNGPISQKNIHDYIWKTHKGTWTLEIQTRNRGQLITLHSSIHATGMDALRAALAFCNDNNIEVLPFDMKAWEDYYNSCDRHLQHMMAKKGSMNESAWQMAFSCDAPNKPGYFIANND